MVVGMASPTCFWTMYRGAQTSPVLMAKLVNCHGLNNTGLTT
jgi:hypothetical protein